MQLKLFILPVKSLDAAEAEMNAFLRSHLSCPQLNLAAAAARPAESHTQSTITGEL